MAYRFFLGANSKDGFVSLFPQLQGESPRRLYLVKGGPGCGKATCIRWLSQELGGAAEYIHCSSDPDSLDGAVLPGVAILDGTAPHVFEPRFPGCDGDYLTLPPFRDAEGLREKAPELYALQAASRQHYASAYRLISAAARIREERRGTAAALLPGEGPEKRAAGLIRQIPRASGPAILRKRFLDGVTPKGLLTFHDTVTACADTIIALKDSFGLAHTLLERLRDGALERGQEVYVCLDPVEPERILHLLLPGTKLAFVTDREGRLPYAPSRTIRADAMLPADELRPVRGQLRLLRQMEQGLLEDAVSHIAAAHALHDRMEAIYRPHIRIEEMDAHYARLLEQIR